MDVDYLIVGQGISGTLLSYLLLKAEKSVIVVDDANPTSCSNSAGGIINPVTGKRLVESWLIDKLLPFALKTYRDLEAELNVTLVRETSILDFHSTSDTAAFFNQKTTESTAYLEQIHDDHIWNEYFRFNYGIGAISPCVLVDMPELIDSWRARINIMGNLISERFETSECIVTDSGAAYKDFFAKKVIYCDGADSADNPYFGLLPWSKDKGEALVVSIPNLPRTHVYKQNISIVPWKDGMFWVGAAHDWKFTDMTPSAAYRQQVITQLDSWLKLPYEIKDHLVARRPSNFERKPFVGFHPIHPSVGIFNGMGGKGCSLGPYFAQNFSQHLLTGSEISPDVNIHRFTKVLSRQEGKTL